MKSFAPIKRTCSGFPNDKRYSVDFFLLRPISKIVPQMVDNREKIVSRHFT